MKHISIIILLLLFLSSCWSEKSVTISGSTSTWKTTENAESLIKKTCLEEWEIEKKSRIASLFSKNTWLDKCPEEKQDFFIQTSQLKDFPQSYNIKKIGKLSSTQSVRLNSNASWRIQNINVKEWQQVKSGQLLASLSDNIWTYNINVEKASNAISRAKINYESQKTLLDKQIADANLTLERLWKNLVNLQKTNAQNIQRNQNDQTNVNAQESLEKIDLNIEKINQNIEKINQNIEKLELDAQNQELSNDETLSGFRSRIKNEQNTLRLSLDDIIEFADEILWITLENKDENDDFERYLWAKDRVQLWESENSLRALIAFRNWEFENFIPIDLDSMTDTQILAAIETGEIWYALVKDLLANLEKTFQNSLASSRNLSQQDIDNYIAQINAYQSSTQWSYSAFIGLKNQIESFVSTYENSEISTRKQIDLLEKDKEILKKEREIVLNDRVIQVKNLETLENNLNLWLESTKTQWDDAIINLENQIQIAQLNYDNAKKNKSLTLQSLDNQIKEANINYSQAVKERAKLSIYAPISGTISSVNIDIWQEVSNGAQLFDIQNSSNSEVVIWLTDEEIQVVKVWAKIAVKYSGKVEKAEIFSISDVADENLNYKTTVKLSGKWIKLWEIVEVYIPVISENILVPLNIVDVDSQGSTGFLTIYNEKTEVFERLGVQLGKNYDTDIEILACENPEYDEKENSSLRQQFVACEFFEKSLVVSSNVSNFDINKFKIVRKK